MFFGLIISLKTLFKSVQHSGSEDINHLRRWRPSNSIKAPDWPRRGIAPNPPSENGLESVQVSPRRTRQDRSRLLGNRGKQMPWKHRGSIVEASWKMKVSRAERKQHHRLKAHQYQYQIKRNQFGKARRGQGWRLRSVQVVYSIQHTTAAQIPKRTPRKLCEIKSMAHRREKIASPLTESL